MEAQELRKLSVDELGARVKTLKQELFHAVFKSKTSETKNTNIFKALRKDVARTLTVMNEIKSGIKVSSPLKVTSTKAVSKSVPAAPEDQDVKKTTKKATAKKAKVK